MSPKKKFIHTFATRPFSGAANDVSVNNIEISEANFLFQIPNFGKDKVTLSPTAYVRNLPWTIMVQLNESEEMNDDGRYVSMSVFVICDYSMNNDWSCNAKISINLLSSYASSGCRRSFDHCFERKEHLKGCDPFISWDDLVDLRNGFIEGHKIVFEVTMRCDEPKCVPWNSKKHTRCIGLENRPENSFLNSLIQILFSIEPFRMSINGPCVEHQTASAIWEMQQIFNQLSVADAPVSIASFIKCLGNGPYNDINTHDTEYFFNYLFKLLQKHSSTKEICDLFHGQISTESSSTSQFEIRKFRKLRGLKMRISVDGDIDELIDEYFASNSCTHGPDSPIAGSALHRWLYGLIRCTNPEVDCYGTKITQLPSILVLHLDRQRNSSHFIIEHRKELTFGVSLDLSKFVQKHVDSPTKYFLHAVLARCDYSFIAFVKQGADGSGWLKFDNDIVSHCTEKQATEDNFRCAQMLVYLKSNAIESGNDDDRAIVNCIICMEVRKNSVIFSTVCGHVFCGTCIKREISLRQKCPVCQTGLTEKDVHPIYI